MVCSCCLGESVGKPKGYVAEPSIGGPVMVLVVLSLSVIVMGVPRAMDQVLQGGAKMVTWTRLFMICLVQNCIVVVSRRSLCGASWLERSIEIGYSW